MPKPKDFCIRGHDLSVTRQYQKNGKPRCVTCSREYARKWNKEHRWADTYKKNQKRYSLWAKYRLTEAQYEQLYTIQKGCCAVCKEKKSLVVDHSHASKKYRSLLCKNCNTALGMVNEDPKIIKALLEYVETHNG